MKSVFCYIFALMLSLNFAIAGEASVSDTSGYEEFSYKNDTMIYNLKIKYLTKKKMDVYVHGRLLNINKELDFHFMAEMPKNFKLFTGDELLFYDDKEEGYENMADVFIGKDKDRIYEIVVDKVPFEQLRRINFTFFHRNVKNKKQFHYLYNHDVKGYYDVTNPGTMRKVHKNIIVDKSSFPIEDIQKKAKYIKTYSDTVLSRQITLKVWFLTDIEIYYELSGKNKGKENYIQTKGFALLKDREYPYTKVSYTVDNAKLGKPKKTYYSFYECYEDGKSAHGIVFYFNPVFFDYVSFEYKDNISDFNKEGILEPVETMLDEKK